MMKKISRRAFLQASAVGAAALALTACGSSTAASGAASAASGAASSTASAAAKGAVTLKVWVPPYAGADADYTDMDFWTDEFKSFESENNCTVEVSIFPWSGYMQKITTGMNASDGPDVIYIDTLYDLAAEGALLPLDSYFTQEEKDNYYYYDMGYVAGGQYVLPIVVGDATVLFCNMDILKQAGYDAPPKNWDELMAYSKKIKEANPDVMPFEQPWGNTSGKSAVMTSFLPYFWEAGGTFLTSDGKPNLNSDAGLKTLNYLYSFMQEGIYDDTIVSVNDISDEFRSGHAAMIMDGTGMSESYGEAGINWDFSGLEGPGGKGYWISGDSMAVAANTKNPDLAVKAIKYMTSAAVMDVFHEKMYPAAPLTKDAKGLEDERFNDLYQNDTKYFHIWPAFSNADSFYDILFKNIQSMYMGDLTAQQVIDNTMKEYDSSAT